MIPAVIFATLMGMVLARAFRVWILIPIAFLSFFLVATFELLIGESGLTAFKSGLLFATAPQTGYLFGQLARNRLFCWRFFKGRLVTRAPTSAIITKLRAEEEISSRRSEALVAKQTKRIDASPSR